MVRLADVLAIPLGKFTHFAQCTIAAIVISRYATPDTMSNHRLLYWIIVHLVTQHNLPHLSYSELKIDGHFLAAFEPNLDARCRAELASRSPWVQFIGDNMSQIN